MQTIVGWYSVVDWGPGWHQYFIIDRKTRTRYLKTDAGRVTLRVIHKSEARSAFQTKGRSPLRRLFDDSWKK